MTADREFAIDFTGIGGRDLGGPPFDICLRSDKHGQSIYGPSVAPMGVRTLSTSWRWGSKAMHEFLVLHYFATDSADGWEWFLQHYIPGGTWMPATIRRAMLMNMFDKCHIAPSYRRMAHQSWASSMNFLVDLFAVTESIVTHARFPVPKAPVSVRGLSMCHLLWRMPHVTVHGVLGGIALRPKMLECIPRPKGERLLLSHYTSDSLCQWRPGPDLLQSLACRYCVVSNSVNELRGHFGNADHSYGHWLDLNLPEGEHTLWQLLRTHADMACPGHRDLAPLRLVSWLSCEPPTHIERLLQKLMPLFSAVKPVASDEVTTLSCEALHISSQPIPTWDRIRDAIVQNLVVGGNPPSPPEVVNLLTSFLRRLPLPRLVNFLDMILPQMVPVKSPCRTQTRRFSSSYLMEERAWKQP